ncbi:RNA polymerase sigma factor [Ensifer adhaerens]|uniref:RNA polymerase sigma factor n=2 Tax=Ensifer adhaerens TaxID=106592 RepID=A0A0L8BKR3_ENSAD|nr:RNA polymerase sigma factor [Ensifer adhaerens]
MTDAMVRRLHEREEGRVRNFFRRRLRNREDAVDATQETFMRMLEASRSTLIENPQAYLFQVARSVARVASQRAAREMTMFVAESEGLEHAEDRPIQDRIVNGRQCLLIMARTIEGLPNRCQQVFILSRLHGLANGEIADQLGISRNMVEKHIIRALLECRKMRAEIFF